MPLENNRPKEPTTPLPLKGPWITKSNGQLSVLFNFDRNITQQILFNDEPEDAGGALRGLRLYRVTSIQSGQTGANEWHKHRTELVFVIKGKVRWECVDITGNSTLSILSPVSDGLLIPPLTMHTYTALEDESEILVLANTIFDPDDPTTHDTYGRDDYPSL